MTATVPVLEKPLTLEEVKRLRDKDNGITVRVWFGLDELIDNDIEGINDLADDKILESGYLSDISYKVCGHREATDQATGDVLIEVTAEVDVSDYEDGD